MLEQQKHKITTASHSQENNHFEQLKRLYEELRILKSNLPKRGGSYTGYWTTDFREQVYEQEKALTDWKKAAEQDKKWIDRYNISRERAEALYKAIDAFQEALLEQAGSPRPGYCNQALSEKFFALFTILGRCCFNLPFQSKAQPDFLYSQLFPRRTGSLLDEKRLCEQIQLLPSQVIWEDPNDNLPISCALLHAHPLPVICALLSYCPEWQLTHRNRNQEGILDHAVYYGNIEAAQLMISKMPERQLPFCSQLLRDIIGGSQIKKQNTPPIHAKHAGIALSMLSKLQTFYKKPKEEQQQCYPIGRSPLERQPVAPLEKKPPANPITSLTGFFSKLGIGNRATSYQLPSKVVPSNSSHVKED
eukprot:TRINITY_DN21855_c0_g2_i3.p1 TRINITY_DN21855_c0_g2~~TRINITY_DN21855_c0_g2_i3.p1  ORF type:complete len:362 (+),score=-62.90 TRINITY_DN21855_c0_g2_i3:21-1106(+)